MRRRASRCGHSFSRHGACRYRSPRHATTSFCLSWQTTVLFYLLLLSVQTPKDKPLGCLISCAGIRASAPITTLPFALACMFSRRYEAPPCRAAADPLAAIVCILPRLLHAVAPSASGSTCAHSTRKFTPYSQDCCGWRVDIVWCCHQWKRILWSKILAPTSVLRLSYLIGLSAWGRRFLTHFCFRRERTFRSVACQTAITAVLRQRRCTWASNEAILAVDRPWAARAAVLQHVASPCVSLVQHTPTIQMRELSPQSYYVLFCLTMV